MIQSKNENKINKYETGYTMKDALCQKEVSYPIERMKNEVKIST